VSFTGDDGLVERLYPLLRGAADFFVHTLVPLPGTDHLVTAPSLSPENVHPHGAALCYGPAMDSQILRDLFTAAIEASERLGRDPGLRDTYAAIRARLPADSIGAAGQLQEWIDDWDMDVPEIHHHHVSHLYALYPGHQIDPGATPQLAKAVRRSLDIRGDDATGWGLGWRINLWARLRDGDHAHAVLQRLLSPDRTYPNMFDAHPPFQIDGNFGGAAGILEMLVQSRQGEIHLLPALPSAWPSGAVRGVKARGNVTVDIAWSAGRLTEAVFSSPKPQRIRVVAPGIMREIEVGPQTVLTPARVSTGES
jgi:alpha-L-fucosidase 2